MNTHKANRYRRTIYDILLAVFIIMFIMLAMLSPTLGNSSFYTRFINGDSNVTITLQENLKQKTDEIAKTTGIEPAAFDFAVGQNKISSTQKEIINAVFAGNDYDYSDSAKIKQAYNDGITEYYRYNGLELEFTALDRAVPMACAAFNETFSISNNIEMNEMIRFLKTYSIVLAIACVVAIAILVLKIFSLHGGRTKVFSHYGSSLICAGDAAILIAICDLFMHYGDRLYLTNNIGFNTAFAGASRLYFVILVLFGVAFDIAGFSMLRFVKRYYTHKAHSQRQETDINRNLYVKNPDGEDKTIGEIFEDRRREMNDGTE